ncbi:MAG: FkbM family methyltransferase [Candidatus Acidiferrales bacterium]
MRFFPTSLSVALWVEPDAYREDAEFILGRLREGDTFIDVGANVGHLTLLAALRVGPAGSVIAIEPHPRTFDFLQKNLRLNHFTQVRAIRAAVGSCAGEARISNGRADDMNHLECNGRTGLSVPVITLDSLGIEGRVALLKTDTEGFEPFVFEGARELLSRVDCIYFECSEWQLNRYGRNSRELRTALESVGFEVYRPLVNSLVRLNGDYDASAGGNLVALRKQ